MSHRLTFSLVCAAFLLISLSAGTSAQKPLPPQSATSPGGSVLFTSSQSDSYTTPCAFNAVWRSWLLAPTGGEITVTADIRTTGGSGFVWLTTNTGGSDIQPVTGSVIHLTATFPPTTDFMQIAVGGNAGGCPGGGLSADAITVHTSP